MPNIILRKCERCEKYIPLKPYHRSRPKMYSQLRYCSNSCSKTKHTGSYQYKDLYVIWKNIRMRCNSPSYPAYKNYGGRGIKICDRWNNFANFLKDVGKRPPGMTLDRIDNDGDYTPDNCHWANRIEQARNTRRNRRITYNGVTKILIEWSEERHINSTTIIQRLDHSKWTIPQALGFERKYS